MQDIVYHCEFKDHLLEALVPARVRIWTLVHAQLIAHSNINVHSYLSTCHDSQSSVDLQTQAMSSQNNARREEKCEVHSVGSKVEINKDNEDQHSSGSAHLKASPGKRSKGYSKRSVSESNLVAARRTERTARFNRKAENRQSMPQARAKLGY